MRRSDIRRDTNETKIRLALELDGTGKADIATGVGFLDHMLTLFARHGDFDLTVRCQGDTQVDGHHSVEDAAYFGACCAAIRQTRAWTVGELEGLGFTVLPSQANFVFARYDQLPGETLYRKLKENGILVRWFDADRIRDYVRITIGSMEQMEALLEALTALLEEL